MNSGLRMSVATCAVLLVLAQVGWGQPARLDAGKIAVGRIAVGAGKPAEKADPAAMYNSAECVLIVTLSEAKPGPVAMSFPPIYTYRLSLEVVEALRGDFEAGKKLQASYGARQEKAPALPVGLKCIVTAETSRDGLTVTNIQEATDEVVGLARTATGLPLGWRVVEGKPVSPWASLGEKAWNKAAGLAAAPGQAVCSGTHRPALRCGKDIKLTVEPVPPAKAIQWTNPDGDGLYTLTVANTSKQAVQVPALLADEKGRILWDESVAIICQDKARPAPDAKGVTGKVRPATLEPGQRVSGTINALALDDVEWPRGGYRIAFQFCLGEQGVTKSFYYMSRHHDAIRDASRQGRPVK